MRESRYRTSFSNTKFFFDCDEIFDLSSRKCFCAIGGQYNGRGTQGPSQRTSCQVI